MQCHTSVMNVVSAGSSCTDWRSTFSEWLSYILNKDTKEVPHCTKLISAQTAPQGAHATLPVATCYGRQFRVNKLSSCFSNVLDFITDWHIIVRLQGTNYWGALLTHHLHSCLLPFMFTHLNLCSWQMLSYRSEAQESTSK